MSKFPGYKKLVGPEGLLKPHKEDDPPIATAQAYQEWHRVTIEGIDAYASVWESPENAVAQVNAGRWIALCFWCKEGMSTSPQVPVAGCTGCGAWYPEGYIKIPEIAEKIDSILCQRPVKATQNWTPGETLNDLRKDNIDHGFNVERG